VTSDVTAAAAAVGPQRGAARPPARPSAPTYSPSQPHRTARQATPSPDASPVARHSASGATGRPGRGATAAAGASVAVPVAQRRAHESTGRGGRHAAGRASAGPCGLSAGCRGGAAATTRGGGGSTSPLGGGRGVCVLHCVNRAMGFQFEGECRPPCVSQPAVQHRAQDALKRSARPPQTPRGSPTPTTAIRTTAAPRLRRRTVPLGVLPDFTLFAEASHARIVVQLPFASRRPHSAETASLNKAGAAYKARVASSSGPSGAPSFSMRSSFTSAATGIHDQP